MEYKVQVQKHFLYPSTIYFSKDPCHISTILGSCIAVCLYDPILKRGAMNHYMMPLWNGNGLASPNYGNIAIEKMIKNMIQKGSIKHKLIAKVFGGANHTNSTFNIGKRNIQMALDTLKQNNIKVVSKSVGGELGRKIIFNTSTSEVLMKLIKVI